MSETKTPQAGEWWVNNHRHEIVRVVGWTATGDIVMEYANGEVLTSSWWYMDLWHHEPRCTGFDWQELSPVDPGEGYKLLTDPIRELGDEWFDGRRWIKSNPALAGSRPSEVAYRRKIETAEVKPPEPEFCTACGVHSVVPGTKTCCGCTGYVSLEGMKAGTVKITPVDPPGATIAMMQPMEPTEFFNKYHPAESPDDWVEITDPDHMPRDGVDWFNGGCNDTWVIHEPHHCRTTLKEYQRSWSRGKFRCRRKDLPAPVPSPERIPDHRPARDVIMDIVSWLDPHPPGVPKPQEALDCAEQWLVDNPVTPAEFCTCPTVDGIQIAGSSCPRHGFATCELKPAVNRVPVRLWVHQDSRNDKRYNVFVKITPPAESNLYREILCDNDGFFLEATE